MRILIIFLKELKDTLRDRRTLFMMVVLPLILMPGLLTVITKVQMNQRKKAEARHLKVRFVGREYAPDLYIKFESMEKVIMLDQIPEDSIKSYIHRELLDVALYVEADYKDLLGENIPAKVRILHKGTKTLGVMKERVKLVLENAEQIIIQERLASLNLSNDIVKAYDVEFVNLASKQEIFGKAAGGFLPYIFIIFGFMGAMYPGLDLGAGEKERGTLETILSSPASRVDIVLGKFFVVLLAAVMTAFIATGGLYLALQRIPDIPSELLQLISEIFNFKTMVMIMGLVLPVCAFFSAIILGLSIYARSFKEAQSMVAPLNIVIIFPAIIGTLPGIELDSITALIPVLNVSLASKDILAGTIDPFLMFEVYSSLILLAGLSIWGCVKWFGREETIFRS